MKKAHRLEDLRPKQPTIVAMLREHCTCPLNERERLAVLVGLIQLQKYRRTHIPSHRRIVGAARHLLEKCFGLIEQHQRLLEVAEKAKRRSLLSYRDGERRDPG